MIENGQTNISNAAHLFKIMDAKAQIRLPTIVTDKLLNLSSKTLHLLNQQSFPDL